jgi:hypothetical protein
VKIPLNILSILRTRSAAVVGGAAVIALAATGGGAVAASLVTSNDIKDGTIKAVDIKPDAITGDVVGDGAVHQRHLADGVLSKLDQAGPQGATGAQGATGPQGPAGPQGPGGLEGAVYRVAHYSQGANGAAIASISCADDEATSQKYVAISGGVQIINADGDHDVSNDNNLQVADSFPGRMDWSTFSPKSNRLDGWVVRFGGNPDTQSVAQVNVWAVCVKRPADLKVQTNDY